MSTARLTNAEIRALGWSALIEKLGPSGAIRFAMQTERGYGDWSEFRDRLLGSRSVDELLTEMKRAAEKRADPGRS